MMSRIFLLLLVAALAHAQYFAPFHPDPLEMFQRVQRAAKPQYASSGASSSSSSSSSGNGDNFFFGGDGGFGFPNQGFFQPSYAQGFQQNFGDRDNGGSLGVRFGNIPGGNFVSSSSSSHSNGNRPGASGSFVSSSSSSDGDGRISFSTRQGTF